MIHCWWIFGFGYLLFEWNGIAAWFQQWSAKRLMWLFLRWGVRLGRGILLFGGGWIKKSVRTGTVLSPPIEALALPVGIGRATPKPHAVWWYSRRKPRDFLGWVYHTCEGIYRCHILAWNENLRDSHKPRISEVNAFCSLCLHPAPHPISGLETICTANLHYFSIRCKFFRKKIPPAAV